MKCEKCNRQATYHSILVVNGDKTEVNLCSECAIRTGLLKGIKNPFENFFDILRTEPRTSSIESEKKCSRCGLSESEFLASGILGCSQCYIDLRDAILPVIRQIHPDYQQKISVKRMSAKDSELRKLRLELQKAITDERYEDAGKINKEIKKLEGESDE